MRHTWMVLGLVVLAGCGVQPTDMNGPVTPVQAQDHRYRPYDPPYQETAREAIVRELYRWVPEDRVEDVDFRMIEPTARYGVVAYNVLVVERSSYGLVEHTFTGNYNRNTGQVKVIQHRERDRYDRDPYRDRDRDRWNF